MRAPRLRTITADARPFLRRNAATLPVYLQPLALEAAARIEPRMPGGRVYTDDVAPVEWLIDSSIVSFAADATG